MNPLEPFGFVLFLLKPFQRLLSQFTTKLQQKTTKYSDGAIYCNAVISLENCRIIKPIA